MQRYLHNRQSIRIPGYDYSEPGSYYVTICAHQRERLFGTIRDGGMVLNDYGRIVQFTWNDLINHNDSIELGDFVIMPDHIHGIITICDSVSVGADPDMVGAGSEPAPTKPAPTTKPNGKHHGLPEIVRQLKTFSAKRINAIRNTPGTPVWQRNYYEHIIRDAQDYERIQWYIATTHPHGGNVTMMGNETISNPAILKRASF
jgi:REP element-mobilizing transposase RayT